MRYEDVVHWDVPLGDSSFVPEIAAAMQDRAYVLDMPAHDGAREMLRQLRARYRVKLLTVRPQFALALTPEWLAAKELEYDELVAAEEAKKSLHEVDALVDDYPGNVADFLRNCSGPAVLVEQPWNQDDATLAEWKGQKRLIRVGQVAEVPGQLERALR
jgi:uncharacterized HAD superfamily protein